MNKVYITDTTLRDGMHAVRHQLSVEKMAEIASKIDKVGVESLEVGHGQGMGGHSRQYGYACASDKEYLEAVNRVVKNTKLQIALIPGVGTKEDLKIARQAGVKIARISTQIIEVDTGEEHIGLTSELGMEPRALMASSRAVAIDETVKRAKMLESYGARVVYLADSAGSMTPNQIKERVSALKDALTIPVGLHAHNNLSLAVANSLMAIEAGAEYIDTCFGGFGAGAGNCPTEILVAVLEKMGIQTNVDLYGAMDLAETEIKSILQQPLEINSETIMLGYASVYSTFLLHARRAAQRFGVDARDVLKEVGRRQCTEGQEDLCIEVAYQLSQGKIR